MRKQYTNSDFCPVQQVQIKCNGLFNLFDEDKFIRGMGAAALARSYFHGRERHQCLV